MSLHILPVLVQSIGVWFGLENSDIVGCPALWALILRLEPSWVVVDYIEFSSGDPRGR
jgi:hypothetical protein